MGDEPGAGRAVPEAIDSGGEYHMYSYERMARNVLDAQVRESFARQVLDEGRPDDGAFLSAALGVPSADHSSHAADLLAACWAFLADLSVFHNDSDLFHRIQRAVAFQRRWQRKTGLIDLPHGNVHSPPDTGFTVTYFAPVVRVARREAAEGNIRAGQIAASLGEYVKTAARGMIDRGFHTPNHRWEVVAALAQAMKLFPDLPAYDYITRIMGETLDMNADGEWSERSNAGYNGVCNRALINIAEDLDWPELLDNVRRSLDMMVHMLHADGTIVTQFSRRQDRDRIQGPASSADSFFTMAQRDDNGVWATIADALADDICQTGRITTHLTPFMLHPEYRDDPVIREPLPDNYRNVLPVSRVLRIRRGKLSATAGAACTTPFSLKYGDAFLQAVRINANWFGISQFSADTFQETDDGCVLSFTADSRERPGYDLPLGREVPWDGWFDSWSEREIWKLPAFTITLVVSEVPGGVDLLIRPEGGLDRVLFEIALEFAPGGEWESNELLVSGQAGTSVALKSGSGVYRAGSDCIQAGPGLDMHRMQMRNADDPGDRFRLRLTGVTPFEHTLNLRCGEWSLPEGKMIVDD